MKTRNPFYNFTKFEWVLWIASLAAVTLSVAFSKEPDWANLAVSLIGLTAILFVSKGNVIGEFLTVAFSLGYAAVSFGFHYYGETLINLLMQVPIAIAAIVSWIRHPYQGDASEVEVHRLALGKTLSLVGLACAVAVVSYFILGAFGTENLIVSAISVGTSFLALALLVFRSPLYAVAFMANDIVLIALWGWAALRDLSYLSMLVCFLMFFANDCYGFYNWRKIQKRQKMEKTDGN